MKSVVAVLALVGMIGGAVFYWLNSSTAAATVDFRTAPVKREELVVAVNATGTVQPEDVVDVGAQVAGRIVEFGKEPKTGSVIDYNSVVEAGTVLARIDDSLYKEEANVARAQLAKAKAASDQRKTRLNEGRAGVERAEADLRQMEARFKQAERDLGRAQKLMASKNLSEQEYDTSKAAYETAEATVGVGKAAVLQAVSAVETAKAAVAEGTADIDAAQAVLNRAERNLDYTTIRSPMAGVIVDRRVNIGQTVVASLNAPSLFLIAKDLKRIEVWASVNEADISRVHEGQKVTFEFDNIPETFVGTVEQVRLNATMTQNVVTYTVIVSADNSAGKLRPYQTANLQFEIARSPSALVVPAAALRWKPKPEQIAPEHRPGAAAETDESNAAKRPTVWIAEGEFVRPVVVRIGASDSGRTEIITDDLKEGDAVVIGEQARGGSTGSINPLAPRVYGSGRPQG